MTGSARQYAKHAGISHTIVNRDVRSGKIKPNADGLIDFEAADTARAEAASPMTRMASARQHGAKAEAERAQTVAARVPTADDQTHDYYKLRGLTEFLKAKRAELDLKVREGELVELAPLNEFVAGMILKAREELTRIAPELRDRLAQETNPIRIQDLIDERVQRALNELREYRRVN